MHSIRQQLRQPVKFLFGIILIALAVTTLCICIGQNRTAAATQEELNSIFMTLALPSTEYTENTDNWILSYAEESPEIVKRISSPSLIGAYIPSLVPDNYSTHLYLTGLSNRNYTFQPNTDGSEYGSAMLEITLIEVAEPSSRLSTVVDGQVRYYETEGTQISVSLEGRIERVIRMADGFADPTGYTARITLRLPDRNTLDALDLVVGERYLIYTTNYCDNDWWLRSFLGQNVPGLDSRLPAPFDEDKLTMLTPEEILKINGTNDINNQSLIVAQYQFDRLLHGMERWTLDSFRSVSFSVIDDSSLPIVDLRIDADGAAIETFLEQYCYETQKGETICLTPLEYQQTYAEPTIVKLDGTAEEFLSSEEGILWNVALENIRINSHAFPVIGVEVINDIADFARGKAQVSEGRIFTLEEFETGAKVCLISDTVADQNGLLLGDTINIQFYESDLGLPYQIDISEGTDSVNPIAPYYFSKTTALNESEEYLIIGIYSQDVVRGNVDNNLYSFTPNTIFVPQTSIAANMDYGYNGIFRSIILESGKLEEFAQAVVDAGYYGSFVYDDNGYSAVAESIENYFSISQRAFWIGIAAYGIILILFLVFFPLQQKKTLDTMESLGATRKHKMSHILCVSCSILIPGTGIGIAVGMLSWEQVIGAMRSSVTLPLHSEMELATFATIGMAQLVIAITLTLGLGMLTTRSQLMRHK